MFIYVYILFADFPSKIGIPRINPHPPQTIRMLRHGNQVPVNRFGIAEATPEAGRYCLVGSRLELRIEFPNHLIVCSLKVVIFQLVDG